MAKYELSKSAENYISRKLDSWFSEAIDDLDEWYDGEMDSIDFQYDSMMQSAVDEYDEERAESWRNDQVFNLDFNYSSKKRALNTEKEFLYDFVYDRVFDRYYEDQYYFVDLSERHIHEMGRRGLFIEFSHYYYSGTGTGLSIDSLDKSDVDEVEDKNTCAMR